MQKKRSCGPGELSGESVALLTMKVIMTIPCEVRYGSFQFVVHSSLLTGFYIVEAECGHVELVFDCNL
jgi:hypothetical protein